MAQRLLVHLLESDILWGLQDASGRLPDGLKPGKPQRWPEHGECVLVVPAERVGLRLTTPPPGGRSRWAQALPYQLEDFFASDIEGLHLAYSEIEPGQLLVAVASAAHMQGWLDRAAELGLRPDAMVPSSVLIARPQAGWSAVRVEGSVYARHADARGMAIEESLAAALLGNEPVQWIDLATGADRRSALTRLSEGLASRIPLSLLQGRFAPQQRMRSVRRQFAWAALLAGLALLLGVAERGWDLRTQRARAELARAEIEAQFRQAFPDVKRVVDPVAQMRTALARMGAAGGPQNALALLRLAGPALARHPGVRIERLEYRAGALDIGLRAPDVPSVDALRGELAAQGALDVQLVSASAGGGGVDGLLRVRRAGERS